MTHAKAGKTIKRVTSVKVNLHEEDDVRHWKNEFGVTEVRLRDAVKAVGTNAEKVRLRLGK